MFIYNENDFNQAAVCVDDKLGDVFTMGNSIQIDCTSQSCLDYVKSYLMGWVLLWNFDRKLSSIQVGLVSFPYFVARISIRMYFTDIQNMLVHNMNRGIINHISFLFNSMRRSDACMRHWTRSSLVSIMACGLVDAKPLSKPELTYI